MEIEENGKIENPPNYLNIGETAKILSVSVETVRLLFDSGKIKGFLTPKGHRRLLEKSVLQYLEER